MTLIAFYRCWQICLDVTGYLKVINYYVFYANTDIHTYKFAIVNFETCIDGVRTHRIAKIQKGIFICK